MVIRNTKFMGPTTGNDEQPDEESSVPITIPASIATKRTRRNRNRGKAHERRTAQIIGGRRIGTMGGEDVFGVINGKAVSVECKSVQACVISGWYDQAVRNNSGNAIPIVVVHIARRNSKSDLAIISMQDLLELTGGKQ